PGRNVRAKSGLNRSILDQGWYEMHRQLEYKQLWRG
ncbi:transposase, partial [Shigella sonnei]